jgi:hypothetical protein
MILDLEDYALAEDYIKTIKQEEIVLWEGRMAPIGVKSILLKNEILLIITLLLLLIGLSIATFSPPFGYTLIILAALLGSYLFYLHQQQEITQYYKLKHSRYIVTPKQCVFIHWYQQQIHINTLLASSIQKVQTDRNSNGEISVIFHTKQAADFEMSYFIDNEKTDSIGFINIGQQANKITQIIRKKVLRET